MIAAKGILLNKKPIDFRQFVAMLICSAMALSAKAQAHPAHGAEPERLKFVLVLTRHGVRSPTWSNARLDEYSVQAWPEWPVAPGLLTPHGKQLMTLFGRYYRSSFAERGLLSPDRCEDAKYVFIDADTDERTVETGHGLAEGLLPGCSVEVHSLTPGTQDPLFHSGGKLGSPDPQRALGALGGRMGDDPAALSRAYQTSLETMQTVLFHGTEVSSGKKSLISIEASLSPGNGDHLVELKGPLNTAATLAENLQLEYLEGMPKEQVGWGRVDEDGVRSLMSLHAASSDLIQRTPEIARVQASNLLAHITRTLEQAVEGRAIAGAVGRPSDRVVFLVGHDTNISNVAALLDAHWLVNGYQRDDAAPGGALVFEVWQKDGGPATVRLYYTVQTPEQMRRALPVTLDNPPGRARIFLPGCSEAGKFAPCSWSSFQSTARAVIDRKYVESTTKTQTIAAPLRDDAK